MAETVNETRPKKLEGIAIGGDVTNKKVWPATENKPESYMIEVSYYGDTQRVYFDDRRAFDAVGVGTYQMFRVTASPGKGYRVNFRVIP